LGSRDLNDALQRRRRRWDLNKNRLKAWTANFSVFLAYFTLRERHELPFRQCEWLGSVSGESI